MSLFRTIHITKSDWFRFSFDYAKMKGNFAIIINVLWLEIEISSLAWGNETGSWFISFS